jgi:NADPH:quinone reductase-like Zn-dependent oxidoreductase
VSQLGADVTIDYRSQDFAEVVAKTTNGRGVDVVIDFVGAPYFAQNIASLANGGRLIQVGILGGGGNVSIELELRRSRQARLTARAPGGILIDNGSRFTASRAN